MKHTDCNNDGGENCHIKNIFLIINSPVLNLAGNHVVKTHSNNGSTSIKSNERNSKHLGLRRVNKLKAPWSYMQLFWSLFDTGRDVWTPAMFDLDSLTSNELFQ